MMQMGGEEGLGSSAVHRCERSRALQGAASSANVGA